ncbi:DNA replication and repair protein RecF [Deinococcus metallilatus]|uniref:DNA replication and repair protein RecF n=1 Tax=Deinococcus metallilatus TaxID=1211322 RepID=A0AAJ5JZR9_9DEIO|nr:DNA replication and repair protein RecF [Deinococcus metallilatus]QBY08129.1 DNA replication and repair protein RecF [Deinococcus metallilatus]RXJ12049.1 DNA replication and repair protein RecF [Deinococcus metallilatus]TLK25907.1 DNA replication and repair protein RecF [Deinococcus metallilatus]
MSGVQLSSLSTLNYRNLAPGTLNFPVGVTGVFGENGAGKTNLLEAAYLALTGLTDVTRLEQLIQSGEREAYVRADVQQGGSLSIQEVGLGRGRRQLKVDGVRAKTGDLPRGSAVWIRPEDSELVFGPPAGRRAYLDALLSRLSARYGQQLARYERTVAQRNAALKAGEDWAMHVWDDQLVKLGSDIMLFRRRALTRLDELAREANAALGSRKPLTLTLAESTTPETYAQDLTARRAEELARGSTVTGPHRDDLTLTLGEFPAGEYASRGEGRTIALALRRAELELLAEKFGEKPVLLIDDFTAELDPGRRGFLLDLAASVPQAIVTGTERAPGAVLTLRAHAGRFTEESSVPQEATVEVGA